MVLAKATENNISNKEVFFFWLIHHEALCATGCKGHQNFVTSKKRYFPLSCAELFTFNRNQLLQISLFTLHKAACIFLSALHGSERFSYQKPRQELSNFPFHKRNAPARGNSIAF